MRVEYGLEETRVELNERDVVTDDVFEVIQQQETKSGRRFTVLVRFDIHQATDKELSDAPRSRLFPRPVKAIGALTPEAVVNELKRYASGREQPASDVSRVLWTEFLAAVKRNGPKDKWVKLIEEKLDDVRALRESRLPLSYAYIRRRRRR